MIFDPQLLIAPNVLSVDTFKSLTEILSSTDPAVLVSAIVIIVAGAGVTWMARQVTSHKEEIKGLREVNREQQEQYTKLTLALQEEKKENSNQYFRLVETIAKIAPQEVNLPASQIIRAVEDPQNGEGDAS